jgi:hypothetical protein
MSTKRKRHAGPPRTITNKPDSYSRVGSTGDLADAVVAGTISQAEADAFLAELKHRGFTKLAEDAEIIARIEQGVTKTDSRYSKENEAEARADTHRYFARRGFWR